MRHFIKTRLGFCGHNCYCVDMLEIGTLAPEFTLPDQEGTQHSLSDYRGGYVLVYFYPKDDTPGCTKEACAIRDVWKEFEEAGITVLGISKDSVESHKKFVEKYKLPFTLLSDPSKEVIQEYKALRGVFVSRMSYLIDPDGNIAKTYSKVDPAVHAEEILKDKKSLLGKN